MRSGRLHSRIVSVGLFVVAGIELLLRSFADVAPLAVDFLTAGVTLLLPFVSDRALLSWGLGWLFLGLLSYQVCYRMDTIRTDGDVGVPFQRVLSAGGAGLAVGAGITLKHQVFAVAFGHGSVPAPVAENISLLLVGSGLFYLVCTVPSMVRHPIEPVSLTAALRSLAYEGTRTLFLGPVLAIAATLYPLPEVAVIGWLVAVVGINAVPFGPTIQALVNDPIERLVLGAAAARSHAEGYITFFYILGGLVFSLVGVIGSTGTTRSLLVGLAGAAGSDPKSVLFVGICVLGPAVYGFWYWLRLLERLPFEFGILTPATDSSFAPGKTSATTIGSVEYRALPAWFGLPLPLLLVPMMVYLEATDGEPFRQPVPSGYVLFACLTAAVALLSVYLTRRREPQEWLSVRHLAPAAFFVHMVVVVVSGDEPVLTLLHGLLANGRFVPVDPLGIATTIGEVLLVVGLFLLPATIPPLLRSDSGVLRLVGLYMATILAALLLYIVGGRSDGAAEIGALLILGAPFVWAGIVYVAEWLDVM
ncbi:hypothetical protein [Natronomonas amylolytica]|uniref:hypothetical protein n=1 Tax=Natronomonas amylolytica TaxID=3108498 RepID=UPI00300B950F